jgi:hypothetical protein
MQALSKILRRRPDGRLSFWCPGCQAAHDVSVGIGGAWDWNGDAERPTFSPSLLMRQGHYAYSGEPREHCWCTYNRDHPLKPAPFSCQQCHSFVRDGQIEFLSDCSHDLAGKTVPIPDWPEGLD